MGWTTSFKNKYNFFCCLFHHQMHQMHKMFSVGERSRRWQDISTQCSHAFLNDAGCGLVMSCWMMQDLPWKRCLNESMCCCTTCIYCTDKYYWFISGCWISQHKLIYITFTAQHPTPHAQLCYTHHTHHCLMSLFVLLCFTISDCSLKVLKYVRSYCQRRLAKDTFSTHTCTQEI